MKPVLIFLITFSINSSLFCQSNRDRLWFYSSVSAVNGQYTSVSPTYSADKYRLANFAGLKGQGFGSNSWFYIDFSGLYYWLTVSMQQNKVGSSTYPFAGQNVVTTTDRNQLLVQDRVGFEIIMTNFKKHENRGFGWQLSTRRFSLDNWGVDDGEYYNLDRGPYNGDQSALAFGGHFNRFGSMGKHIDFRAGFYVNGLVSLNRVGVMAYPDLQVITHFGILGIMAKVSYEGSYLYAPTRGKEPGGKVENLDPAKNTGLVYGLHYEIGAGIDLNYLMKPFRRKNK